VSAAVEWRLRAAPLLFGLFFFAVNEGPVVSGYLAPAPGSVGTLLPQHMDFLQYQTWINAYQRSGSWLLPDFHAPWATEPALLNPLCWFMGRVSALLRVDGLWLYHLFFLAFSVLGGYALFFAIRAFAGSAAEGRLALLMTVCAVPVASLFALSTYLLGTSNPCLRLIWFAGKVHAKYNGDGFVNGVNGSLMALFGTATTVLAMGLVARFLQTDSRAYLRWAGLVAGASAFLHPFEIFVVMAAGGLALVTRRGRPWARGLGDAAWLVVPGCACLAPYAWLTSRHAWLQEAAVENRWQAFSPPMLVMMLGLPTLFCLVSYALPLQKGMVTDRLLTFWFLCVLAGVYVPWIPWSHHLLDGVHYATALLVVRQAARWDFTRRLVKASPVLTGVAIGAFVFACLSLHAITWAGATAAARMPGDIGSAVITSENRDLRTWLAEHAHAEDLVLAPKESAGEFATVPMHSFASHWLFSLTWEEQVRLSDAFYRGSLDRGAADSLLAGFGVRYAVIPDASPAGRYFANQAPVVRIGSAAIYEMPNARLRPFAAR